MTAAQGHWVEEAIAAIERISPERATLTSILIPLNRVSTELANRLNEAHLLAEVHPDPARRAQAEAAGRAAEARINQLWQSRALYAAISELSGGDLDPQARRVVDLLLQDMRRAGVELDDAGRAEMLRLRERLVELSQRFLKNLREDRSAIMLCPEELDGLPEDYIAAHAPGADGLVRITTESRDLLPFLNYASSGEARKRLKFCFESKAYPANAEVLPEMLAVRHAIATRLGHASWAEYAAEDKMIGSAEAIIAFIERALEATRAKVAQELAEMLELKKRDRSASHGDPGIGNWELRYFAEKIKRERLSFDARAVRPYFEYTRVKQGVLKLIADLYELSFRPVDYPERWHASAETYAVFLRSEHIGLMTLDMHPRPDKSKHAACFTFRQGVAGIQEPHYVLVCNFPDPAANEVALLDHSEMLIFFHEFGHVIQGLLCGRQPYHRTGQITEWDFVEAPSQVLEEYAYDYGILSRFARHHQTGEAIPEGMVRALREARDLGQGLLMQRQLAAAAISFSLHIQDPTTIDIDAVTLEQARRYFQTAMQSGTHFAYGFWHLEGYSSVYYTYPWSVVISKDLVSGFPAGLFDIAQAHRYRDLILTPGGSQPAAELVRSFLGRPYNFEGFRRWLEAKQPSLQS